MRDIAITRRAANKSERAAIEDSIEHWAELCGMTAGEMRVAFNATWKGIAPMHPLGSVRCALCVRHRYNCKECPLGDDPCGQRDSTYWRAAEALSEWRYAGSTSTAWRRWKRRARRMLAVLKAL